MTNETQQRPKVTVPELARMKALGEKISMITAYDVTFARLVDLAGVDMILVGDSVGMVVQGEDNTIPVGLDDMVYHVRLVSRAKPARPDRRRSAVRLVPGQPAAGGRELDPADEGGRRVREARRRHGDGRDHPGPDTRRHPRRRPHRPHAAELPSHGRPQGAGSIERLRGGRPRAVCSTMPTPSSRPARAPW